MTVLSFLVSSYLFSFLVMIFDKFFVVYDETTINFIERDIQFIVIIFFFWDTLGLF